MLANDMCKAAKHERSKSKSGSSSKKASQKLVEDSKQNSPESISELKGEPDFIETNCHWKHCNLEFQTQAVLVQVCSTCMHFLLPLFTSAVHVLNATCNTAHWRKIH